MAVEVELHDKRPARYADRRRWYKGLLGAGAVRRALAAAGLSDDRGQGAEVQLIDPTTVTVYGSARLGRETG